VSSLLGPRVALADSDGYYCLGADYLAYQFGMAPPPVRPHFLYVVRLTPEGVRATPKVLELPPFQVHGMRCNEHTVRIAGYDTVYTIELDSSRRPIHYVTAALPRENTRSEFLTTTRNLGMMSFSGGQPWGKTYRELLLPAATGHTFVLEFVPDPKKTTSCSAEITTRVLELDRRNRVAAARQIFHGIIGRECGGD